jgi:hypothetical protein
MIWEIVTECDETEASTLGNARQASGSVFRSPRLD